MIASSFTHRRMLGHRPSESGPFEIGFPRLPSCFPGLIASMVARYRFSSNSLTHRTFDRSRLQRPACQASRSVLLTRSGIFHLHHRLYPKPLPARLDPTPSINPNPHPPRPTVGFTIASTQGTPPAPRLDSRCSPPPIFSFVARTVLNFM